MSRGATDADDLRGRPSPRRKQADRGDRDKERQPAVSNLLEEAMHGI